MLPRLIQLAARLRAALRHEELDRDLDEELASHASMAEDDFVRQGLTRDEARRAANRALGSVARLREEHREVRTLAIVDEIIGDARYGLRSLVRNPGFGVIAIVILAIGIGANTAMFSVLHSVLMQPLAYPDSDRIVFVGRVDAGRGVWLALPRVEAIRSSTTSFTGFGAYLANPREDVTFAGRGEPEVLRGARVSANFLDILDVRPAVGRSFLPQEDAPGGPAVAMISAGLWRRRFGATPSIEGLTATLDSAPHTIIGVLPEGFRFPFPDVDVWLTQPNQTATLPAQFRACCVALMGFARLKPGVSLEHARADLDVASAQYAAARPRAIDSGALRIAPLKDELTTNVSTMLWMLLAAVGFVLLIACANVATLLMERATSRGQELALRSALGARRGRLIRQLVTESLVLSVAGGALGLVLTSVAIGFLTRSSVFVLPRADEVTISGTTLLFTMAMSVATGLLFGMLPALQVLTPRLFHLLRQSGTASAHAHGLRRWFNPRGTLVVIQVALSLVLLVGAALMMKSLAQLSGVDSGFPTEGLLTARVPLPAARYDSAEKRAALFERLSREIERVPSVQGVVVTRTLPATSTLRTNIQIIGKEIPDPGHVGMVLQTVTPGFFEVLGVRIARGREFTPRDNTPTSLRVAIVNESFARRFWPEYPNGVEPIGRRLQVPIIGNDPFEIVGVVADVRQSGPGGEMSPQFYIPNALYPPQSAYLAIRASGDPAFSMHAVREAVMRVDPDQSIADVRTMDEILEGSVGRQHMAARLLGAFAGAALLLALVGLYGALAYSVTQRTQEIGIRRALGAGRPAVLGMVMRQALRLTLVGIAGGLAAASALTKMLDSFLFQVSATDPATFAAAAALFVMVAALAALIPAWRAARIDPMKALRS
ncbi:MAG TPA: ABC transporter permease [Vicinamibacterales bacterium]|nr:ABC transporter permease [Vicinamibacterales bacterium]